jgi:hypothetical protein
VYACFKCFSILSFFYWEILHSELNFKLSVHYSPCSIEDVFGRYWDIANTIIDLNIEARDSTVDCNIQVKHK